VAIEKEKIFLITKNLKIQLKSPDYIDIPKVA
jgi:hypothetical protein